MGQQNSDALVAKVRADISSYTAGMKLAIKQAEDAADAIEKQLGGKVDSVMDQLGKGAMATAKALAGVASAAGVAAGAYAALMHKALDLADGLVKVSDKTGISIEELQRLKYVAGQVGLGAEDLEGGLSKFTLSLGKVREASHDARLAVGDFSVALSDDSGPRKSEDVLLDVLRVLEKIPDANARAAAAADLFAKTGVNMGLLASQGAGGLDKLRQAADDLGLVIGEDLVRHGDDAGDSIERLKTVIETGLNKALLQAAPDIEAFFTELTKDPQALQQRINDFISIGNAFVSIGSAAAGALGHVVEFAEWLGRISAELVNGPDDAYREEIDRLNASIKNTESQVDLGKALYLDVSQNETDLARYRKELEDVLKLQSSWKSDAETPAVAPPAAVPDIVPSADGGTITVTAQGKKAHEEATKAARDQEKAELDLQAVLDARREWEDVQASDDAKRLEAKLAADRDYNAQHEQLLSDFEEQFLDSQTRQVQAEEEAFSARLANLAKFSDAELETVGGYNKAKEDLIAEHESNVESIRAGYLQSGLSFLSKIENDKARAAADGAAKTLQVAATFSKKAFEASKALAIADAIINTYKSAVAAYSALAGIPIVGPALGAAAAAAAVAAGLANVQAIRATKFGGGGASGAVAGAANPQQTTQPSTAAPAQGPTLNLTILPGIYTEQDMRRLAEQLHSAYSDGTPKP